MKKTPILLIAYFVWISESHVDAYLDPGSGSMLGTAAPGRRGGRGGDHEARMGPIQGHVPLVESEAD